VVVVVEEEDQLNKKVSKTETNLKKNNNNILTLYVSHNGSRLVVNGMCLQSLEDGTNAILKMLKAHVDFIHLLIVHIVVRGESLKCTVTPRRKLTYLLHTAQLNF
jgi:hypothetical protein